MIKLEDTQKALVHLLQDIEKGRKETEEERQKLDQVLKALADGVVLVNNQNQLVYLNPKAQEIMPDLKIGDDIGVYCEKRGFGFSGKINLWTMKNLAQIEEVLEGRINVNPGDEETNYHTIFAPLKVKGAERGAVGSLHDITELCRMDKLKSDFVATVSHELRTPLTVISEAMNLLRGEVVGALNPEQQECLMMAKRNIERLAKLVDDVLDLSKLEAGRLEIDPEKASLNQLLKNMVEFFRPVCAKKNLSLELKLEQDVRVIADLDKTEQILTNLLNNSYKFTEAGGQITVTAGLNGGFAEISVEDTGMGISQPDQSRLFSKFTQVGNRYTRQSGGTGLGLYITKKLVEAQGGDITVESDPGKGTKITFTLPVYKEAG